ncbi:kinesin family member C1 [Pancytospora philotis]|nr:kinesin family member C1 [Pancytospora philotis]
MEAKLRELEFIFSEIARVQQEAARGGDEAGEPVAYERVADLDPVCGAQGPAPACMPAARDPADAELLLRLKRYESAALQNASLIAELQRVNADLADDKTRLEERVRALRGELISARGAVQVLCRIKPSAGTGAPVRSDGQAVKIDGKCFQLDRVFGEASTQREVYEELAVLVESVMEGYKACVFAYGQTGSGKTHTMVGPPHDSGLIARSLAAIAEMGRGLVGSGYSVEYRLKYIEVYNEVVHDLIGDGPVSIVHDGGSIQLKGCEELRSADLSEMQEALLRAGAKRRVGRTECNERSSRSHLAVMLDVVAASATERRTGSLVLVDLAGSERLSESKAADVRLWETQHINRSLSMLGNVFMALRRGDSHVPFRDSKLTHLMQEYLTGRSRTVMIVNISPDSADESVRSLRLASKVAECRLGRADKNVAADQQLS